MNIVETIETFERDVTSVGFTAEVRDDGSVRATTRNRWQGSIDGAVYLFPPGTINLTPGEDDPDIETQVRGLNVFDGRKIRSGSIVR